MTNKLPPMPEMPPDRYARTGDILDANWVLVRDVRAMLQADRLAVWNAALEAAAKACEDQALIHHEREGTYDAGKKAGAFGCASAIRLLEETN